MKLTFKILRDGAQIPAAATKQSAGLDLKACIPEPMTIDPGEIKSFPIGLAVCPEKEDVALLVFPRSGLASKHGITLPNCVGVIDSDYRGEISVPLINLGREPYTVMPGERLAQLITVPIIFPEVEVAEELPESERGTAGFGSSGRF